MKRFALFLLAGGTNTIVGLSLMIALSHVTGNPYVANIASYVTGFFLSFWLQDVITFRNVKNKSHARIITYFATYVTAFIANLVSLNICLRFTPLSEVASLMLSAGVFVITSYVLMNSAVFVSHSEHGRKRAPAG